MKLLPYPRKVEFRDHKYLIPKKGKVFISTVDIFKISQLLKEELEKLEIAYETSVYNDKNSPIKLYLDENLFSDNEEYRLIINEGGISIYGSSKRAVFYGVNTFKQLLKEYGNNIPYLYIEDYPDFKDRGVMIDISRDKVPKLETIYRLIDILSEMKINQLQFYIEHTFKYEGAEEVWKDYSPLSPEDIMRIQEYAKERFVELVPNQNSFGHMAKWLIHDKYKHLAETTEFTTPWGEKWSIPFSLSPVVPESINFVDNLYKQLLPHFESKKFNVGCDETFDLCQGKSKEECDKKGEGRVYFEFLLEIYELVKKYGKTMMFWGDIIKNHPELVEKLPKDVIALIWGYEEDHPYEKECKIFAESHVPFYVCPGTSSWLSFIGRYDNMKGNIENSVLNGKRYGSLGVLVTDWGDNGHWQHLPFSVPGFAYAADLSWNADNANKNDFERRYSLHVFKDVTGKIGEVLKELGNAYKKTKVLIPNSTIFARVFTHPEYIEKYLERYEVKTESLEKAKESILKALNELESIEKFEDADIVKREIKNGAEFATLSIDILIEYIKAGDIEKISEEKKKEFTEKLNNLANDLKALWLVRNKEGGLKYSLKKLMKIKKYL
ncbi:MAG: family 20 glycosylhydrolase [Thermotogaceae bacterium]|nr:family 20 glycosylhydrolase [Thermotogaceae bacterium]